jgi:hypothetical protein
MVKMTEEQKAQRMAARRRAEAEAEEARELRREAKRREWVEKSMYLTYDEMMAGMPCRGCGEILWDGKGKPFVPINNRTEEDQREIDEAEAKFQELHPDCHEGRWSMPASSTLHCHLCCPSSPMSPTQREKIRNLFSVTVSPRSLNRWELTLTCDHVVETTANKESTYPFGYTWRCDQCGRPRGIISRRMLGPTEVPEEPGPKSLTATEQRRRETLRRNLAKVQAELASLEAKAAAAEAKEGGHAPRSVPTPR